MSPSQGCQPPTSSDIENWWGRDERWCHNALLMTSFMKKILDRHKFVMTQYAWKRCCWPCNTWLDWFTSHQSHYFWNYNSIMEFMRKHCDVNCKIAQKMQNSVYLDSNEEMANFGDYLGDFEIRSKIWSPPDSPGELTTLASVFNGTRY